MVDLQLSYEETNEACGGELSKIEYVVENLFEVSCYDEEICGGIYEMVSNPLRAITNGTTFELVEDLYDHMAYILTCNLPFFANKISWGTSIRGAWWDHLIIWSSCAVWNKNGQITKDIQMTGDEFGAFVVQALDFAREQS